MKQRDNFTTSRNAGTLPRPREVVSHALTMADQNALSKETRNHQVAEGSPSHSTQWVYNLGEPTLTQQPSEVKRLKCEGNTQSVPQAESRIDAGRNHKNAHGNGIYRRGLRHLAKRLKNGKRSAIIRSAQIFADMLPRNAYVVPMPSHNGFADVMFDVAKHIKKYRKDITIIDILYCSPHYGMYATKKSGRHITPPTMYRIGGDCLGTPCVIDNVIDTGLTFNAVKRVLPNAELYTIATTTIER